MVDRLVDTMAHDTIAHKRVPEGNCFPVASWLGTAVVCLLGDSSQQQNDDFLLKEKD
jgi:hypothetical protein